MRRRVVEELGRSRRGRGDPAPARWPWPTRAGRCARPPPSSSPRFDEAALLPALEAALRDDENAGHAQRGHGDLRQARAGRGRPPSWPCSRDEDEEVRNFAAVMLGALRDARGRRRRSSRRLARSRRQRAPRRRGQPRARSARRRRCRRSIEALRAEPWLQYPAIHALGEIGDAARGAGRSSSCSATSCCAAPVLEALGRLAGRDALPRLVPHLYDPDAALRNAGHPRGGRDRAARDRRRREPRSRGAGRAPARGPRRPPARRRCPTTTPHNRRTAAITLGWLKEPRAERRADRAAWPSRALQEYVDARARLHRLPGPRGLSPTASSTRTTRCGRARVRCLAWIAPAGRHRPRGAPHPRSLAGGAGGGGGGHRPAGRRGRGHAALRAARRRERADPGERHGRARAHARRSACVPLLLQALAQPGGRRCACGPPRRSGSLRDPSTAPALIALSQRPARERAARRASRPWARSRRPDVPDLLRAGPPRREQPGAPAGGALPGQAPGAGGGRRPPARCSTTPIPKMRFVTAARPGPDPQPRRGARACSPSSATRARSCASPRSRPWARSAPWRRCARSSTVLRDPDRNLRRAAAESLGAIGDPQAVPPLLLALEDEHWSVRCAAATALGRIRSAKAVAAPCSRASTTRTPRCGARWWRPSARSATPRAAAPPDPGSCPIPACSPTALEALRRHRAVGPARDRARLRRGAARGAAPARGPRRASSRTAGPPPPARRPGRRQRAGARGGGAGPRRRRLPRRAAAAHGPEGLGPVRRGPAGGGAWPSRSWRPGSERRVPARPTTTSTSPRRSSACCATSSTSGSASSSTTTSARSLRTRLAGAPGQPGPRCPSRTTTTTSASARSAATSCSAW